MGHLHTKKVSKHAQHTYLGTPTTQFDHTKVTVATIATNAATM